jgi:hypothetical protein
VGRAQNERQQIAADFEQGQHVNPVAHDAAAEFGEVPVKS